MIKSRNEAFLSGALDDGGTLGADYKQAYGWIAVRLRPSKWSFEMLMMLYRTVFVMACVTIDPIRSHPLLLGVLFIPTLIMLWIVGSKWPYADKRTDWNDKHHLSQADQIHGLSLMCLLFIMAYMAQPATVVAAASSTSGEYEDLPASRIIITIMVFLLAMIPFFGSLVAIYSYPEHDPRVSKPQFDIMIDNPMNRKSVLAARMSSFMDRGSAQNSAFEESLTAETPVRLPTHLASLYAQASVRLPPPTVLYLYAGDGTAAG